MHTRVFTIVFRVYLGWQPAGRAWVEPESTIEPTIAYVLNGALPLW